VYAGNTLFSQVLQRNCRLLQTHQRLIVKLTEDVAQFGDMASGGENNDTASTQSSKQKKTIRVDRAKGMVNNTLAEEMRVERDAAGNGHVGMGV